MFTHKNHREKCIVPWRIVRDFIVAKIARKVPQKLSLRLFSIITFRFGFGPSLLVALAWWKFNAQPTKNPILLITARIQSFRALTEHCHFLRAKSKNFFLLKLNHPETLNPSRSRVQSILSIIININNNTKKENPGPRPRIVQNFLFSSESKHSIQFDSLCLGFVLQGKCFDFQLLFSVLILALASSSWNNSSMGPSSLQNSW